MNVYCEMVTARVKINALIRGEAIYVVAKIFPGRNWRRITLPVKRWMTARLDVAIRVLKLWEELFVPVPMGSNWGKTGKHAKISTSASIQEKQPPNANSDASTPSDLSTAISKMKNPTRQNEI